MFQLRSLATIAGLSLALTLSGCGDEGEAGSSSSGAACSCGEKVCGFDACGNSCGATTQLELQGEDEAGISCDTHTTCDGAWVTAARAPPLGASVLGSLNTAHRANT